MLVGLSMLLLAAGALAARLDPSGDVALAAGVAAWLFTVIGVFALVWGGVHLWAGALLRRHHPAGRTLGLALAVVNLLVLPFGTALGIYLLWVLLADDGRRLFEPTSAPGV